MAVNKVLRNAGRAKTTVGCVHSVETLGARDGPGLRCVFFLSGCNFRCSFCQNPDTWGRRGGRKMTLDEARERIVNLLPYLRHRGGLTVSGGEPCLQPEFVEGLFRIARELGLNTALDTNGSCPPSMQERLLAVTDLVMLDIKACDDKLHREITGRPVAPTLAFGRRAALVPGRLLIRRVILPGINDSRDEMDLLAAYALGLDKRPKIELIPYHTLGAHKWKEMGLEYPLASLKPPTAAHVRRIADRLKDKGLQIV
jgi:pyruvate formate lyase activating enzyme